MTYWEPFDLARENRIRFFRDAMVGCVDDDARAVRIELMLARHEYRVVPDSTVLTAEEARVLVRGVVGWDQAQLDIDEATHDRAMAKLRTLSSQHTERKDTPEWGPDHPSYDEMGQ